MSWARLDDAILDNAKIAQAGALGLLLHVAGITWCARNLTNGFIPKHKVTCLLNLRGLYIDRGNDAACPLGTTSGRPQQVLASSIDHPDANSIAVHLAGIDLWHDRGEEWEIHDYLKYNPSREEVLSKRQHAREKKQLQRARPDGRPNGRPGGTDTGTTQGSPATVPSHPVPVPVPGSPEKRDPDARANAEHSEAIPPELRGETLQKGPIPPLAEVDPDHGLVLLPRLKAYFRKCGCSNPELLWRHWHAKRWAKRNDPRTWCTSWYSDAEAWALNHAQYGCPCQRRRTDADKARDAELEAKERGAQRRGPRTAETPGSMAKAGDLALSLVRGLGGQS